MQSGTTLVHFSNQIHTAFVKFNYMNHTIWIMIWSILSALIFPKKAQIVKKSLNPNWSGELSTSNHNQILEIIYQILETPKKIHRLERFNHQFSVCESNCDKQYLLRFNCICFNFFKNPLAAFFIWSEVIAISLRSKLLHSSYDMIKPQNGFNHLFLIIVSPELY